MEEQPLLSTVWRGRYLILTTVAVAALAALFISLRAEKVYEAATLLQVRSAGGEAEAADPLRSQQASQVSAKTYATLLGQRSMLERIAPRLQGAADARALDRAVTAAAIEETGLIELTIAADSPERARDLADGVAGGFIEIISETATRRVRERQRLLEERLNEAIERLRTGAVNEEDLRALRTTRDALATQLATLTARGIEEGDVLSLVGPPTGSDTPVRPRTRLNLMAGVLLGLLLGVALAALRIRVDRRVGSSEEAEEILGVPVLASIPLRRRLDEGDLVLRDAYDLLHANLAFPGHRGLRVVAVTSYRGGEGKSASAQGVAFAAARAGRNVLLLDGDVRTHGLSSRLGFAGLPGLAEIATGSATLDESLRALAPGLGFLPAGATPRNPPAALSSEETRALMVTLRDDYDLVVIDTPALAHIADGTILAGLADGIVVMARIGQTERDDLRALAGDLRRIPVPLVGLVVLESITVNPAYARLPKESRRPPVLPLRES